MYVQFKGRARMSRQSAAVPRHVLEAPRTVRAQVQAIEPRCSHRLSLWRLLLARS